MSTERDSIQDTAFRQLKIDQFKYISTCVEEMAETNESVILMEGNFFKTFFPKFRATIRQDLIVSGLTPDEAEKVMGIIKPG